MKQYKPTRFSEKNKLPKENKTIESNKNSGLKKRELLGVFLTGLSVIGALLTLIGYGVALSLNNAFTMPGESLFTSPFDLIELSAWAINAAIAKTPNDFSYSKSYIDLIQLISPYATLVFIGLSIGALSVKYSNKVPEKIKISPLWVRTLISRPSISNSVTILLSKSALFTMALLLTFPLLVFFTGMTIICIFMTLIFAPLLGMQFGADHIAEYVVSPKSCYSNKNREARISLKKNGTPSQEKFATCVIITRNEKNIEKGRVVFTTSSAIILWNPVTGTTHRIPTRNIEIQVVDQL